MFEILERFLHNRRAVVVVVVVLMVFIGVSVTRCVQIHPLPLPETSTQKPDREPQINPEEEERDNPDEAEGESGESVAEGDEQALPKLGEEDAAVVKAYDKKTSDFIALLTGNVWATADDKNLIEFSDATYKEIAVGRNEGRAHTFVVESLSTETDEGFEANKETTVASIRTEDGIYQFKLVKYTQNIDSENDQIKESSLTLSSDAFGMKEYMMKQKAKTFAVTELESDLVLLLGNSTEKLTGILQHYRDSFAPTSTNATWDGKAKMDWNERRIYLLFSFDNQANTKVTVTYNMDTKTFTVNEGVI